MRRSRWLLTAFFLFHIFLLSVTVSYIPGTTEIHLEQKQYSNVLTFIKLNDLLNAKSTAHAKITYNADEAEQLVYVLQKCKMKGRTQKRKLKTIGIHAQFFQYTTVYKDKSLGHIPAIV
jgi:hypothetical protein